MTIPFDHTQKALDANLIAGNTSTTVTLPVGPHTDTEVWRSWVDPGLSGTFNFIEATLRFRAYAQGGDASAAITWKWQIRPTTQAAWADLHSEQSSTLTANIEYPVSVIFDAVSPTAEDVPFELRLIMSTSDTDDELLFIFSSTDASSSVLRVVGESL